MNEITPTNQTSLPMSLEDLAQDAGLGGKVELKDIAIPYLYVLQTNSPQCNPDHAKYIKGATAGMLYLSNLERIYPGREAGLLVVPCYYERLITEWLPRSAGGGLIASHDPDADIVKTAVLKTVEDKEVLVLPNGHELVETAYHYFLAKPLDENTWIQCIAPFKSTSLKASRRMNSIISTSTIPGTDKKAPRFLFIWRFSTIKEQKDNYVWSSPKLEQMGMVSADVYASAKAYAQVASTGLLRRALAESEMEDTTGEKVQRKTEDAPF